MTLPFLSNDAFVSRLREEGSSRYHDGHPFHLMMHAGELTKAQLQQWVINRFYYQTRIPIKDAILLSKSTDPSWRRQWIRRIHDHDGVTAPAADASTSANGGRDEAREGGLTLWLRLAAGLGLDKEDVESLDNVLPAVRFACDAYVQLVREKTLVEGVASSLTEFFSPDLMSKRILAWEKFYPWVDADMLAYFRSRVPRARRDSEEALAFVVKNATTRDLQERCVRALITKCEILWALLDAVYLDSVVGAPRRPAPPAPP